MLPRWRIRVSVFAIPCVITLLWLEGLAPFSVMLASALFHELGHITALKLLGYRLRRIDVLPMGALIVVPEGIPYHHEMIIALSGPLSSLVCSFVSATFFSLTAEPLALFGFFANLVFALFNMLPERKLDGGKALFCFLIDRKNAVTTERVCSVASALSKLFFVFVSSLCALESGFNFGVALLSAALLVQLFFE